MVVRRARGRQWREGTARVRAQRRAVRSERARSVRGDGSRPEALRERVLAPHRPASCRVPRAAVEALLLAHARLVCCADGRGCVRCLRAVRAHRCDAWWAAGEVRGCRCADVEAHVGEGGGLRRGDR